MWTEGTNPHDAVIKNNTIAEEVPLLLAGGYYLANIYQKYPSGSVHHMVSILTITAVIVHGTGAEVANTFGFLVEAPLVLLGLRGCLEKLEIQVLYIAFGLASFLVYLASNVDLCYLNFLLLSNDEVPSHLKFLVLILSLFVFTNAFYNMWAILSGEEEELPPKRGRSRSRSRGRSISRGRGRSRSRGTRVRKR